MNFIKNILYTFIMIKISKSPLIIALFTIIYTNISMALEEPKYQILKSNNNRFKDSLKPLEVSIYTISH